MKIMKTFVLLAIFLLVSSCNGQQCYVYYTVPSTDVTCDSIASDNGFTTDQFAYLNPDVDCNNLQVGEQICLGVAISEAYYQPSVEEEEAQTISEEEALPIEEEESQPSNEEQEAQSINGEEEALPIEEEESQAGNEEEEAQPTNEEEVSQPSNEEQEAQPTNEVQEAQPSNVEEQPYDSVEVELFLDSNHEWPQVNWPLLPNEEEAAPSSGVDLYAEEVIYAFQVYRDKYDLTPFTYSYDLANNATKWAKYLAENNKFEHSGGGSHYGESLAGSYYGVFNPAYYIDQWGAEQKLFIPDCTFPDCSTDGLWYNVGHYTQIIWRDTKSVGCGYWTVGDFTVYVCQYWPPGNALGSKVY
jgi:uncharacterized protein YkwD